MPRNRPFYLVQMFTRFIYSHKKFTYHVTVEQFWLISWTNRSWIIFFFLIESVIIIDVVHDNRPKTFYMIIFDHLFPKTIFTINFRLWKLARLYLYHHTYYPIGWTFSTFKHMKDKMRPSSLRIPVDKIKNVSNTVHMFMFLLLQ